MCLRFLGPMTKVGQETIKMCTCAVMSSADVHVNELSNAIDNSECSYFLNCHCGRGTRVTKDMNHDIVI